MNGLFRAPLVTVIMPVYNGAATLQAAINSVVGQTWPDWELIIVDDSSTDGSDVIAMRQADPRIRLLRNPGARGVAAALNCGLEVARGDYLARMDADDLCRPARLARQVAYLDAHPGVSVLGCWVQCFGAGHDLWRYPVDDAGAKARLLFDAPFAHPTVMLRSRLLADGWRYDEQCGYVEDYELWLRGRTTLTYANLAEPLLDYRLHSGQVGVRLNSEQQVAARKVRSGLFEALGIAPGPQELELHDRLAAGTHIPDSASLKALEAWLLRLDEANRTCGLFDHRALENQLAERWWQTCHLASHLGADTWKRYHDSPLRRPGLFPWLDEFKFSLRCRFARPSRTKTTL